MALDVMAFTDISGSALARMESAGLSQWLSA